MPSQPGSDSCRRLLVAVGTAHFAKLDDSDLKQVPAELERIGTAFTALGYERLQGVTDPDRDTLRKLFADVNKQCVAGDIVVAYYTGHGVRDQERFYLLTNDSDLNDLDETALPAEDLARALTKGSKASQVLVILDACYAGAGAAELAQIGHRLTVALGQVPGIFVIAAARPKQEAEQGALSLALQEALANHDGRLGGPAQPFLAMDEVMGAVDEYLSEKHPAQVATLSCVSVRGRCRLFPNPRHWPGIRPGLDLATQRAFTEHWVPKARGAELGAGGWYFTGREQVLSELAAWLSGATSGRKARVVTGGPGCGKSAVLARVVTLSNPQYRKDVLAAAESALLDPATFPPEGIVSVAVHARHKLLAEVVTQIAEGLKLNVTDPDALVQVLASRPKKSVIVIDALDESEDKEQIVARLLRPLAGLPYVFLLIGTRPDSFEYGRKFRALGESTIEVDLDAPHYIGADDITRYVERRLLATEEPGRATPYRGSPALAHAVAQAVSVRAKNVFLVAHTAVFAILAKPGVVDVSEPGWINSLPTGLDDAFASFLGALDACKPGGLSSQMAQAVFLPLAFAEGEGLPWVDLWATVATAISDSPVLDADIALVRQHAAPFIVEAVEKDRSVYRVYHEKIAELLRASVDAGKAQQRIVKALRTRVPVELSAQELDWPRAHPYILTHFSNHALKAGLVGDLVADGRFIAAADPLRTLQFLSQLTDPFSHRAYTCYALAYQNLYDHPAEDRLSYLELAARQLGDDALAVIWIQRRSSHRWATPWVRWSSVSPHRVIPDSGNPNCIALGILDNRPVIVSGGEDGVVRVWDLATGLPIGKPSRGHEGPVNAIALGTRDNRPVIVSGGKDGMLRVWDLATGLPIGKPLRGNKGWVNAIALGMLENRQVVVSGGGYGMVRVWDLATCKPRGEPLDCDEYEVDSIALSTLKNQPVIVSGGTANTLRVWDLATGAPRAKPLCGHSDWLTPFVLGTLENQPVIVSGGGGCMVRVWDLATLAPRCEPLRGHKGRITSIALGMLDDRQAIVSGGSDGTVRVWDLATGVPQGEPLHGHEYKVNSIALGTLENRPVIVSGGGDYTVRVWDLATRAPSGESLHGQEYKVRSIALGTLENRPVIVSGGEDGKVRVWDLATCKPRGEPLHGHESMVRSLALGTLENRPVIVSGGEDGMLRVWDLATGTQRGRAYGVAGGSINSIALGTLKNRPVIVSGGSDGTVRMWDLATGRPRGKPKVGNPFYQCPFMVNSIALGTLENRPVIVSGGEDGAVLVLDLATRTPIGKPLRGHVGMVNSVALGTLKNQPVIVSGGQDGSVRVWDLATGRPRGKPFRGHVGMVNSVALGTLKNHPVIVSSGSDLTVRVWGYSGVKYATVNIGTSAFGLASTGNGIVVAGGASGLAALLFE